MVGICLPDEVIALRKGTEARETDVRRLFPAREDALPLYVTEQGAVVGKSGETLQVKREGKLIGQARMIDVSQLCVFGGVSITPFAVHSLCEEGKPICYFSFGGWFYGITHGFLHKNVELRRLQFRRAESKSEALAVAKSFVEGKIMNCRTLLRRNIRPPPPSALAELQRLARLASRSEEVDSLRGIEGAAANVYFSRFAQMVKGDHENEFDFASRNRRPPTDPVNALLSFMYSMLVKDVAVALMAVGFDPYLGFYHVPRYGRPALALDMMEEFRPLVADSVVLTLLNRNELSRSDFVTVGPACALTKSGRRRAVAEYHRRLDTLVAHPTFGYSISYGRILEVQARLLGRWVQGEIPKYPFFHTR